MPSIPIRKSPIKPNPAASGVSSTSTRSGSVPQSEARVAKEPTRLVRKPAFDRATSSASARGVNESKPRDRGLVTNIDISGDAQSVVGHNLSANYSSVDQEDLAVSEMAVGAGFHAQHGTPVGNALDVVPTSRMHGRPMSVSSKSRETGDARSSREAGSKPNTPIPSYVRSLTVPKAPLARPAKAPVLSTTKPAFSTYQKHFSPRKAATPPGSSLLASDQVAIRSGTISSVTASTEIQNLKDELFQLSLVQEGSAATLQSYETSMKLQLKSDYEVVEEQLRLLKSLHRDRQATTNALAMSRWLDKQRHVQHAARVGSDTLLLLAHILTELQDVSKANGPLEDSMKIFEGWRAYTSSRRSKRDADNLAQGGDKQDQGYILRDSPAVTPQWSVLVSFVEDRIRACAASLGDLQRPPETSSIGLLTKMSTILAEQILQEIGVCRAIEGLIVREERVWVARAVEAALSDAELHHSATNAPQASARRGIWTAI